MTTDDTRQLLSGDAAPTKSRKKYIIIGTIVLIIIVVAIILIVVLTDSSDDSSSTPEPNWSQEFLKGVSSVQANANSRRFTRKEHVAGTEQNNIYASDIRDQFLDMEMESEIIEYSGIYLSEYNGSSLYQVNTSNPSQIINQFNLTEDYIPGDPTSNTTLRKQAWLGYSANGEVTGYIIYVNYGDHKDFDILVNKLGFDIGNKSVIALVRYGALLRGIKALNAAEYGFKAVIVYSDPNDYGPPSSDPDGVVPDGPWLPDSGFQRGSSAFINRCFGNPSRERAVDRCGFDNESYILPSIPIIPLSYGNAKRLMEQMNGDYVNESEFTTNWQGGIDIEYRLYVMIYIIYTCFLTRN